MSQSRSLETAYKEHLIAARNLYVIVKAVKSGEQWRQHRLPETIANFERTCAALKLEAEKK